MKKLRIPANLTALAYDSIKEYILDGRLDESSRLTEEFLADRLGISKSPIREALNRLEAEGLIRIEARRGAYLRRFSMKEIDELYDLREALEVHAVRTATVTPVLLAELKESTRSLRKFLKANDKAHYIEEDVRFHAMIAKTTGSELLSKELESVQNRIWLFRRNTYELSSSSAVDHHEAIVNALEADRGKAERAMREHIGHVRRKLIEFLSTQQSQESEAAALAG